MSDELAEPPLELGALHVVGAQGDPAPVGLGRTGTVARAAQQLGARRVQRLVAREHAVAEQRLEQREPGRRPLGEPDGDRAVDLDDRRRRDPAERAVELGDLRPVGRLGDVLQGDRGLQLVRAGAAQAARPVERGRPLADPSRVPARAVLAVERDEAAALVDPRAAARVVQQHQREQPVDLGVVGHQPREQPAEPDRLAAQLAADEPVALGRAVALVEDQVHDLQHAGQPVGQRLVRRHAIRDVRVRDLALRARQPLPHRRLRDEERARDLAGGQAAERAERQRDARRERERRMAAGEDQAQAVVRHGAVVGVHVVLLGVQPGELREPVDAIGRRPLAPEPVDRLPPRRDREPGARVARDAVARPGCDRRGERILDRVLGELEVAGVADRGREHRGALLAPRVLDRGRRVAHPQTGRTSTAPYSALGIRAPMSIAPSRSSASIR